MNIIEMRKQLGISQMDFAIRYHIPFRTIQNWETGQRKPPQYIVELLEYRVKEDLVNCKTKELPAYNPQKKDLPKRRDYVGAFAWLKAVRDCIGQDVVFALDEALMCSEYFGGRSSEDIVWLYGNDDACRFNGVVVLGNQISPHDVDTRDGVSYTCLNRTLSDAFANESILDMQGITEAVSKYYYKNGESFSGISVAPEYQYRFEKLAKEAKTYYNS